MQELETDLRLLLTHGVDGARALIGDVRLARTRRAAGYLAEHESELRTLGLLAFGEKPGDLHLAPALDDALARALSG